MKRPRGVLLDVDGTLVDSNDAHAHAWVEALAEHGIVVPFEKVRPLIGMGGDKLEGGRYSGEFEDAVGAWEADYFKGRKPDGAAFDEHETRRRLRGFETDA